MVRRSTNLGRGRRLDDPFCTGEAFVCSFLPTMEETNQRKIANKGEDAARGRQFFPLFGFSPIFRDEVWGKGIGSRRAGDCGVVRGCFSWFACRRDLGGGWIVFGSVSRIYSLFHGRGRRSEAAPR